MSLVFSIGPGGQAKELNGLGNTPGIGRAARSLLRYVKENRALVLIE